MTDFTHNKSTLKQNTDAAPDSDTEASAGYPHKSSKTYCENVYQPPSFTTGSFNLPLRMAADSRRQNPQYQQPYYSQYYQTPPPGYHQKSRIGAALVALLFGGMGVHNFYLGFTSRATIQLLLFFLGGPLTLGLLSFGSYIWGFVEGIQILIGKSERMYDSNKVILRD